MVSKLDAKLAYATTAVGISVVSLIAPALPELADLYGVSVGEIAAIQVAALVPGIVSARWLLGRGADHGLRRMLGQSMLGYAVSGGLLLLVISWPLVLALRVIQGVFSGGLVAGAFALLGSSRDRSQSRIARNAALVCAMMAIQPLVGAALSGLGPRFPFGFYLLGFPLGFALLAQARPPAPLEAPKAGAVNQDAPVRIRTPREPLVLTALINALLFGWLLYLAPVLLAEQYDVGINTRGFVLSGQAALGAMTALAVVPLLRRGRQRHLLYVGFAVPAIGLAAVGWGPNMHYAIGGFLLVGATYGAANPALVSILTARGPRATGAWQSSARVGQVVGPAVAGWLVVRAAATEVLAAGVALGVAGLLYLAVRDLSASRSSPVDASHTSAVDG